MHTNENKIKKLCNIIERFFLSRCECNMWNRIFRKKKKKGL